MTHIRVEVLEQIVRQMGADHDRDVRVVQSDLQYLSLPQPTYPTWWAIVVGAVLTADQLDTGAIATGTVLESAYLLHGTRWSPGPDNSPVRQVFAAAGLPLIGPAAGMSEALTTRVALDTPLGATARSCLRGSLAKPCLTCIKCLRKELLTAAVTAAPLSDAFRRAVQQEPRMLKRVLAEPPLHMQNVFEFALARVEVSGTPLERVRDLLQPTIESTAWMTRYYGPALEKPIPEQFRPAIEAALNQHVEFMDAADRRMVETWDAEARVVGHGPSDAA